jgi:hypothetical protein
MMKTVERIDRIKVGMIHPYMHLRGPHEKQSFISKAITYVLPGLPVSRMIEKGKSERR